MDFQERITGAIATQTARREAEQLTSRQEIAEQKARIARLIAENDKKLRALGAVGTWCVNVVRDEENCFGWVDQPDGPSQLRFRAKHPTMYWGLYRDTKAEGITLVDREYGEDFLRFIGEMSEDELADYLAEGVATIALTFGISTDSLHVDLG